MYRSSHSTALVLVISALLLGGCAKSPPKPAISELQRDAMIRWKGCLQRHIDPKIPPSKQASRLITETCEGHQRDVVALFPRHLAGQIDKVLVGSAYRYMSELHETDSGQVINTSAFRSLLPESHY